MPNAKTAPTETMDIDWGVVAGDNTEFAAQYPRMQYVHGNKQASGWMKQGGFFIHKEQYPNFEAEGFEPGTLITREGEEIEGYAAAETKLAVIRVKHQWVKDKQYGRNVPLAHILCVVKGRDDLVCISLKGGAKALDFQKAFNLHITQNVSLANRTRPQGSNAIEPFALWFPVRAGEVIKANSKDGKSSSPVTPPELVAPEQHNTDYVRSLWVGRDNYLLFAGYYQETAAWQKQQILVERDEDAHVDDVPAYSGGDGDPATPQQLEHLVNLCQAKGFDVKQLALAITNGATNNIETLSKVEAREAIEQAKAA